MRTWLEVLQWQTDNREEAHREYERLTARVGALTCAQILAACGAGWDRATRHPSDGRSWLDVYRSSPPSVVAWNLVAILFGRPDLEEEILGKGGG